MQRRLSLALAFSLWAAAAQAQTLPAPPAASGTPAASATPPLPPPPTVTDPLLEPPPAPTHVVGSWREALAMVKARSVELQIALADIEPAQQAHIIVAVRHAQRSRIRNLVLHCVSDA